MVKKAKAKAKVEVIGHAVNAVLTYLLPKTVVSNVALGGPEALAREA